MLFASHLQTSVARGGDIRFACDFGVNGYMQRTPDVTGDVAKWTFFTWVKRDVFSGTCGLFGAGITGNPYRNTYFGFAGDQKLYFGQGTNANDGTSNSNIQAQTDELFTSAEWFPVLLSYDTENNQAIMETHAGVIHTHVGLTTHCRFISTAYLHVLGGYYQKTPHACQAMLAHPQFVDGGVHTLADFVDITNMKHREFSDEYGALGWHLDFADQNDLGKDVSGNNNHWSLANASSISQVQNTPTHPL